MPNRSGVSGRRDQVDGKEQRKPTSVSASFRVNSLRCSCPTGIALNSLRRCPAESFVQRPPRFLRRLSSRFRSRRFLHCCSRLRGRVEFESRSPFPRRFHPANVVSTDSSQPNFRASVNVFSRKVGAVTLMSPNTYRSSTASIDSHTGFSARLPSRNATKSSSDKVVPCHSCRTSSPMDIVPTEIKDRSSNAPRIGWRPIRYPASMRFVRTIAVWSLVTPISVKPSLCSRCVRNAGSAYREQKRSNCSPARTA